MKEWAVVGIWGRLLHPIITTFFIYRIAVGVVDKALFLKEVTAASISRLINWLEAISVLLECVILDVNLRALVTHRLDVLLDHADEAY